MQGLEEEDVLLESFIAKVKRARHETSAGKVPKNSRAPNTEEPIFLKDLKNNKDVGQKAAEAKAPCKKPRSNPSIMLDRRKRNLTWGSTGTLQYFLQSIQLKNAKNHAKPPNSQRSARQTRKRKQNDMAHEGDMEWEALMGDVDGNGAPEKQRAAKNRAKAAAGSLLFAEVQAVTGESAAVAVGLKARAPGPAEKIRFKDVLKRRSGLQEYLECRNTILGLWESNVHHILTVTDCGVSTVPSKEETPRASLIREIYEFLNYNGYINMGIALKKGKPKAMTYDGGTNPCKPGTKEDRFERLEDEMTNEKPNEDDLLIVDCHREIGQSSCHKIITSCENSGQDLPLIPDGKVKDENQCMIHHCKREVQQEAQLIRSAQKFSGLLELVQTDLDGCSRLEREVDNLNSVKGSERGRYQSVVLDCPDDNPFLGAKNEPSSEEDTGNADKICRQLEIDAATYAVEHSGICADANVVGECDNVECLHVRCDDSTSGKLRITDSLENQSDLSNAHHEREKGQKHIIVVGAGPAGLSAASHLQRIDVKVTVLEARERIGGRVYTDRLSFSGPVDLGASIITGVEEDVATERRPDPSALICRQLNLELTTLRGECPLYDSVAGSKVSAEIDEALEAEYNSLLDDTVMLVAQSGEVAMRMSLEEGLESALKQRRATRYQNLSCTKFQDSQDRTPKKPLFASEHDMANRNNSFKKRGDQEGLSDFERRVMDWHFANLEYGCAAELKLVSLPYWNQDDVYGGFGGPHCMIKGGYSTIMEALGNDLNVHLRQVVTRIEYCVKEGENKAEVKRQVKVQTAEGDEFVGDAVLITVPLGCLKANTIQFSPPLPDWKCRSINQLGFGLLNKVVLEFPVTFWDDTVDYFGATQERTEWRGRCFMFWNLKRTVGAPILIALVVGKAAIEGEKGKGSDLIRHALSILRKIFGEANVPEPVASIVTNWGTDPFSRGAYSYVAVGASGEDYDIIGRPVENCLFFAGEATCKEHPDTVGGAMMSGIREAIRITDILENRVDSTAEAETMAAVQRQSDSERNEVRDMVKRLASAELANAIRKDGGKLDGEEHSLSKAALLQDMFWNAKTTAGRLYLAKELLQLPASSVKAFAGTKDGLTVLNTWILDSMGKDGTKLLRCCVHLLLLVATDLVSIRQSGIGRTVKEKVYVHTSRDIRAVAGQLVKMWVDVHKKEKATQGILRPVKQPSNAAKHQHLDNSLKGNVKISGMASLSNTITAAAASKGSESLPSASCEESAADSLDKQKQINELPTEQLPDTSEDIKEHVDSDPGETGIDLTDKVPISETEAAALAAVKTAQAAALAAAKAFATAEASRSVQPELPKILSFHKFAQREYVAVKELSKKENIFVHGKQHASSGAEARTCKVRNWSIDFSGSCNYFAGSDDGADSRDASAVVVPDNILSLPNMSTGDTGEDVEQGAEVVSIAIKPKHVVEDFDSARSVINTLLKKGQTNVSNMPLENHPSNDERSVNVLTSAQMLSDSGQGSIVLTSDKQGSAESLRGPEHIKKAVCDYVALLLAPLYKTKRLQKDAFKSIVKKATYKVMERSTDEETAMTVSEFLDIKRKNKIRSLVDKFVERYLAGTDH